MNTADGTHDTDPAATAGPAVLRLEVADLDRTAELYGHVLGGVELDGAGTGRRWWLPPDLVIEATAGPQPGPRAVLVAVDDLAELEARAAELGIETAAHGEQLVITDPRVGGGELVFAPTDAAAAQPVTPPPPGGGGVGLQGFDHVCLAVPDLELGMALVQAAGGTPLIGGDSPLGGRVLQLGFPRHKLELMMPVGPGPIAQFLDRRGGRAGIQHATAMVRDVLVAVAALDRAGFATIGTDTTTQPAWHETYVRPRSADRLLLQLAATTHRHRGSLTPEQAHDVLAGRYIARDYTMRRAEEVAT